MTDNIYNDFYTLTGKNIVPFLNRCVSFFTQSYPIIVKYFEGKTREIDSKPFKEFEDLQNELEQVYVSFESHQNRMKDSRWYQLIEDIEEIENRFATLKNIHRWTRSSATEFSFSPNILIDHTLLKIQSIEKVLQTRLQDNEFQDSWYKTAIDNNLREEDYALNKDTPIQLSIDGVLNLGIRLESVVDVLNGKSIYGKDLHKSLQYDTNTEDLRVLSYDDTVLQSVEILLKLRKRDNPDFPELGLQSTVIVGSNRALMNFPIINRQLIETFSSDDTLKQFTVLLLKTVEDNVSIDFEVFTRLNEVQGGNLLL